MTTSHTQFVRVDDPVPSHELDTIRSMEPNALIVRLMFTINHLSRWLSPIHDADKLERSVYRGEPTPKDLVIRLRQYDKRIYPRMYLAAHEPDADFDTLEEPEIGLQQQQRDTHDSTIVVLSQFRRLRQTSTALLRALPDSAWDLRGRSRSGIEGSIRSMAEALAIHDYRVLRALDQTLDQVGARDDLAQIQKTPLDELLELVPDHVDIRV